MDVLAACRRWDTWARDAAEGRCYLSPNQLIQLEDRQEHREDDEQH